MNYVFEDFLPQTEMVTLHIKQTAYADQIIRRTRIAVRNYINQRLTELTENVFASDHVQFFLSDETPLLGLHPSST